MDFGNGWHRSGTPRIAATQTTSTKAYILPASDLIVQINRLG